MNDVASFEDYRPDDEEMLSEALEGLLATPKTLP